MERFKGRVSEISKFQNTNMSSFPIGQSLAILLLPLPSQEPEVSQSFPELPHPSPLQSYCQHSMSLFWLCSCLVHRLRQLFILE